MVALWCLLFVVCFLFVNGWLALFVACCLMIGVRRLCLRFWCVLHVVSCLLIVGVVASCVGFNAV